MLRCNDKINMVLKYSQHSFSRRLLVLLVVLVLMVIVVLELTNTIHLFHRATPSVTAGSSYNSKGEPKSAASKGASGNKSQENNPSNSKSIGTTISLAEPSGAFVSNHHPNLSGSPAPNTMSSVCNTTPNASCQIHFSINNTVKSLPAKTADVNGAVFWDWAIQDIGLYQGEWKVTAVTTLGEQTKTASDAVDLVVAP